MANYKEKSVSLGFSDVSSLCCRGWDRAELLDFGGDGSYSAWLVDDRALIPDHYKKVLTFDHWLKIFDDEGLVFSVRAKEIEIYRAGEMGCLIYVG